MQMPSGCRNSEPTPRAEGERHRAQQRRHGRHHDGTEAQQAGLIDRLLRRLSLIALGFEREIDHHDGVLLHDADQQNDSDKRDNVKILMEDDQRQNRAHARRGQRGKNGDGVNEAFVQDAQHQIYGDDRGQNQQRFIGQRGFEGVRRSLERRFDAGRHVQLLGRLLDVLHRRAQRRAGRKVERNRDHRKLALVVDGERNGPRWWR